MPALSAIGTQRILIFILLGLAASSPGQAPSMNEVTERVHDANAPELWPQDNFPDGMSAR